MDKRYNFRALIHNKRAWVILFLITYAVFWFKMPEQVPLYYSQVLKADKLASKYELLIIPLFVYLFFEISERWLYKLALENKVVKQVITYFLVGLAVFSYIIFFKIVLLIT